MGSVLLLHGATKLRHYYGHDAVEDQYGVIAPWYSGQNGQFDLRVRIAAETMKRYPWVGKEKAVMPAPEFVLNGTWNISDDGAITVPEEKDWANGDLGQRAAYLIRSMMKYYRYSGDAAAWSIISSTAEYLVGHCQTPADHGWPRMLISVPNFGVRYEDCRLGPSDMLASGSGKIQLDIVAEAGLQLVRAYEMTGETRWYEAAKHWADLLAQNRRSEPGQSPWGRYANNADGNGMNGVQTGGVAFILAFFDELIRTGYTGQSGAIVAARDDARAYLGNVLLPAWLVDDTWGRNYWDWEDPVQAENVTEFAALQMMDHKDAFPNWRDDARNVLSLFLNHTSDSPKSNGDIFSGAWAYPESSGCCARSLWYGSMELASVWARYGVEADSEWAREIARRSQILATYDVFETGRSMDLIDGGSFVNDKWFKIAHPMALDYVLGTMAWLPDIMGANRENHLMRTSAVVRQVAYGKDEITYQTFDAPVDSVDVLRLAYSPQSVTADGRALPRTADLTANGYTVRGLAGGDYIVSIRHDGATTISLSGSDPQEAVDDLKLNFKGQWNLLRDPDDNSGAAHVSTAAGASVSYSFTGNQVRLIGRVGRGGGRADVFLDGIVQFVPVNCFSPIVLHRQILYYRNGLGDGPHELKVVVRGEHNPASDGDNVYVDGVQYSTATGDSGFGSGGGPRGFQRLIFGYPGRTEFRDSLGNLWRPATEFTARTGNLTDSVAKTWWTMRQAVFVSGTPDQELYRYGVHWPDFSVNLTVAPGSYNVHLKFAETQYDGPGEREMAIYINGRQMTGGLDVFKTAGGLNKAVDVVYDNVQPENGVVAIRFVGAKLNGCQRDAMIQALEIGPGNGSD